MTDIDQYDYELPSELIAQEPLANRTDSRLLVVNRAERSIDHYHFRDLPSFLRPNDALVLNDTRVLPAALAGYRQSTGGRWQGLYLDKDERDVWKILCKTRGKLVEGEKVGLVDRQGRAAVDLTLVARLEDGMWAAKPESKQPTFELLEAIGRVPLPHYIRKGEALAKDRESYQTVFAEHPGSVAAPTAGLHFSDPLLAQVAEAGVVIARVTLHVGIGTFRPVKTQTLDDHQMHAEWCELSNDTLNQLQQTQQSGGRILAVGTTCVRTLETAAQTGELGTWKGATGLFIRPPFEFKAISGLITNFHLPKSTLLVLVQTFTGDDLLKQAYREAIEEEYRFFSYGDAMLII